jgi:hypothetical protein
MRASTAFNDNDTGNDTATTTATATATATTLKRISRKMTDQV